MNKRPLAVIGVGVAMLLVGLMLMACGKPIQMCAVEEVEVNKDSKGKIVSYEIDYMDGREIKISQIQYNMYRGKTQAPCRP